MHEQDQCTEETFPIGGARAFAFLQCTLHLGYGRGVIAFSPDYIKEKLRGLDSKVHSPHVNFIWSCTSPMVFVEVDLSKLFEFLFWYLNSTVVHAWKYMFECGKDRYAVVDLGGGGGRGRHCERVGGSYVRRSLMRAGYITYYIITMII